MAYSLLPTNVCTGEVSQLPTWMVMNFNGDSASGLNRMAVVLATGGMGLGWYSAPMYMG